MTRSTMVWVLTRLLILDEDEPFVNSSYQKRSCVLYFDPHKAVVVAVEVEVASIRISERIQVSLEAVLDGKAGICDIVFIAVPFFDASIYHMIGIRSTLSLCNKACFADTSLEKHG